MPEITEYILMQYMPILSSSIVIPSTEPRWSEGLSSMFKRRAPRIWQLAHICAKRALKNSFSKPKSIVCATALGALDETRCYLEGVYRDGYGSPKNFIASVHNSMAGKLALDFSIYGPNLTICEGHNSFASAIVASSILKPDDYPVLLLAVDEKIELLDKIIPHLSKSCRQYLSEEWTECAVCFIVDSPRDKKSPCLGAAGPRGLFYESPMEACSKFADEIGANTQNLKSLHETSNSFIKPALYAYKYIRSEQRGDFCIGSYSPSAKAVALVSLCL